MFIRRFQLLFVPFVFATVLCLAQTDNASISGRVTDPSGATVPGTVVELQSADRGTVTKTTSNESGIYVFPAVRPGTYHVTLRKAGFQQVDFVGLTVNTQDHIEQNFSLKVGAVSEAVTVEANAIAVETSSAVSDRGEYANDAAGGHVSGYDSNYPGWGESAEQAWGGVGEGNGQGILTRPFISGGWTWTGK